LNFLKLRHNDKLILATFANGCYIVITYSNIGHLLATHSTATKMDFLSKSDLIGQYNVTTRRSFERLIGAKGKKVLDWKPGKQRFTPKQIRALHKVIGEPLTKEEKYH